MNGVQYLTEAKEVLGAKSDRELGERLAHPGMPKGYSQQAIAAAKVRGLSDGIALAVGLVLEKAGRVDHAGEVLLVAHAERDSDPLVRNALMAYVGKVIASAAKMASAAAEV